MKWVSVIYALKAPRCHSDGKLYLDIAPLNLTGTRTVSPPLTVRTPYGITAMQFE
jgi:hypothetical protein